MKIIKSSTHWAVAAALIASSATIAVAQQGTQNQNNRQRQWERLNNPPGERGQVNQAHRRNQQARSAAGSEIGDIVNPKDLIGKTVVTREGQRVGRLQNLVLDLESGRILYAAVNVAKRGTDRHLVAVSPQQFGRVRQDVIRIKADQDKIMNAPEFSPGQNSSEVLGRAEFVNRVYQHFGDTPWWPGSNQDASSGSFKNVHLMTQLQGVDVHNVNNKPIGQVRSAVVDLAAGRVVYVIFVPERSLNLGNDNLYALPPNLLTKGEGNNLVADINREKLASAPSFQRGQNNWSERLGSLDFATRVYQHYGKEPYFQAQAGSAGTDQTLEPTGRDQGRISDDNWDRDYQDIDNQGGSGWDDDWDRNNRWDRNRDRWDRD